MTAYQKGLKAEKWARWYLRLKGYRILTARYKTALGEIDVVARRGRRIIFLEVKQRPSAETAAEAISADSRQRIRRAAELYLQKHTRYNDFDKRFDAVLFARGFWPRHIQNAF